jgi:hypothetical protein
MPDRQLPRSTKRTPYLNPGTGAKRTRLVIQMFSSPCPVRTPVEQGCVYLSALVFSRFLRYVVFPITWGDVGLLVTLFETFSRIRRSFGT